MAPRKWVLLAFTVAAVGLWIVVFLVMTLQWGFIPCLLPLLFLGMLGFWMLFAFVRYRQGRQDELLHVLITAVEAQVSLAPALRAYLEDRPQGLLREFFTKIILFFVLPGYYWIWHQGRSFDCKVALLAHLLELGVPLPRALQLVPGVASREMRLAALIGQSTGQLAFCLHHLGQRKFSMIWFEILPRLLYPLGILVFISLASTFWAVMILPKMRKIFKDFGEPLPDMTRHLANTMGIVHDYGTALPGIMVALMGLAGVLTVSSTARWYCPIFGYIYRRYVQSQVLPMLGMLLKTGKPVPEALALLAGSEGFAGVVCRRLDRAGQRVSYGEPLAASLRHGGLASAAMTPLIQTSERLHNVPWALAELGESVANRTTRLLRRFSLLISPLLILAIGILVGCIVLGIFMPLVDLMMRLSE